MYMRNELISLRRVMAEHGIDYYLVPTDDFHSSEYVGEHFKCRAYVSGFTGSAGTLLVGQNWAGLWTDGRYFLQAAQQLENSGTELCKSGEPGVPKLEEYLKEHLQAGNVLGFDGRTVNAAAYKSYQELAEANGASISCQVDLVGEIWTDRPPLPVTRAQELPLMLTGQTRAAKLADVRKEMEKEGADVLVMASLTDICWMLNLRGRDVECVPVILCFAAVTREKVYLFCDGDRFSESVVELLGLDGVEIHPYGEIYRFVRELESGSKVMMNLKVVNSAILDSVPEGVTVLDRIDPTELPKACKNPTEVGNFKAAHIKDGVAVTKFMRWLKKNIGKVPMTEISVAEKLEEFRSQQEGYLGPSFHPIMAWGPHGAIVHYSATEESNAEVQPKSFLLSDTGGHYMEGSTDITRTFAMGPLTDEEKWHYTLVLKGHLNLGAVVFKEGCTGANLDLLARQPLWEQGLDFNHGTGHGVGYLLNIHEGPQRIHWKSVDGAKLEPGMITSNEPGIYLEGKFGVRLENLVVVKSVQENSYGRFLKFEDLTMVPWDLDAIDATLLTEREKALLNDYHRRVRNSVMQYMTSEEAAWLRKATRAI
ncbi:MAG: aminopeptidase P family protein [Oscillospiraceae bacterium]|nr:aminopeptidase P family protein [Oscillospiraceae bacterium]